MVQTEALSVLQTAKQLQNDRIEAKDQYDQDMIKAKMQITIVSSYEATVAVDDDYTAALEGIVKKYDAFYHRLLEYTLPWSYFSMSTMSIIFSFCSRHWFVEQTHSRRRKKRNNDFPLLPFIPSPPPVHYPEQLQHQWTKCTENAQVESTQLLVIPCNNSGRVLCNVSYTLMQCTESIK